jgi:NAD(P)-dependent dehydrogenase (short-subunit alcohol dehydrogenase family)
MNIHHKAVDSIPSPPAPADDHPFNPFPHSRVAVTGGTSGLGLALVRELLNRGAEVALVARGQDRVKRVVQELSDAHGIVGDVSRKEDTHPIAMQIVGALGGLDVLINNASVLGGLPVLLYQFTC